MTTIKDEGKLRLEGRDYIMQPRTSSTSSSTSSDK